jgi:hypothetical protein
MKDYKLSELTDLKVEASIIAGGIRAFSAMSVEYAFENSEIKYFHEAFVFLKQSAGNLEKILDTMEEIIFQLD